MTLPFDQIACLDYETFYDDEYSLKKMSTTDYVRDDRFEAQTCAIHMLGCAPEPIVSVGFDEIAEALREIDWSRTAFLGHHTQFDGLIATHHFGIYPAFWLDTMSMARMVFGVHESVSLHALAIKLGLQGKVHKQALEDVKGAHIADMTPEVIERLAEYNADDASDTGLIYQKLAPLVPDEEKRLIDITVRMYAEPTLLIDGERVARIHAEEKARKQELFDKIGLDVTALRKDKVFAEQLEALGVEPPRKLSLKRLDTDGKPMPIYAFAKNDYAFQGLLQHPDDRVRWLVEGRLASKSSLVETRSASILRRVGRPTPIYLNYYGAHTGRWSGGDSCNWQNLPRRGLGAELRKSLVAPEGCKIVVSDAAQIEARMLAWHAEEEDVLAVFASNGDVYSLAAEPVYGRPINGDDDPDERFVGKVLTLGAGYGAGAAKINYMLKIGAFGPPVLQSMEQTQDAVYAWRAARRRTVQHWKTLNEAARSAFLNLTEWDDGVIGLEGTRRGGYMHLPNGAYIFYPSVQWDADDQQMKYIARNGPVKLYGGILAENATQALARVVLGQQMLVMEDEMPDMRIALCTHDEVLLVVPEDKADVYAKRVHEIMSTTPYWAAGLPLNAKTTVSTIYEKT